MYGESVTISRSWLATRSRLQALCHRLGVELSVYRRNRPTTDSDDGGLSRVARALREIIPSAGLRMDYQQQSKNYRNNLFTAALLV